MASMMAQKVWLPAKIARRSIVSTSSLLPRPRTAAHQKSISNVSKTSTSRLCSMVSLTSKNRRLLAACRASNSGRPGEEPSSSMNAEMLEKEMESIDKGYNELMSLMSLMTKFPDFDIAGKHIYCDQLDGIRERVRTFLTRPEFKEATSVVNKAFMAANTSLDAFHNGMVQQIRDLRAVIQEEESILATANPQQLAQYRKQFKEAMADASKAHEKITQLSTMDKIMKDPALLRVMINDPAGWMRAFQDVATNPKNIDKYKHNQSLYDAMKKIFDL